MARRPAPESAEDRAIREVDAEDTAIIDRLALAAGPPADSSRLSEAEEDEVWATTDPLVDADPDAFATQLMTTGIPQEMLPQLRILKENQDWAQLYAQPTQSAEMADYLTRLAQYPHRATVLLDIDDPEEQVRKAEALDRRFQRRHVSHFEPMMPPSAPPVQQPMAPAAPMPQQPAVPGPQMPAPVMGA